MKPGTSLVSQLLDGHENLFVLHGDSRYIALFYNKEMRYDELLEYWITRIINPSGKPPFWFLGKDEEIFRKFISYLYYFYPQYKDDPFLAVVFSIFAANP